MRKVKKPPSPIRRVKELNAAAVPCKASAANAEFTGVAAAAAECVIARRASTMQDSGRDRFRARAPREFGGLGLHLPPPPPRRFSGLMVPAIPRELRRTPARAEPLLRNWLDKRKVGASAALAEPAVTASYGRACIEDSLPVWERFSHGRGGVRGIGDSWDSWSGWDG